MKTSTVLKKFSMVGAGAALFGAATSFVTLPASAAVTVLDFENIAPYPNGNNVLVQGFYNGGTSSIGTTGTNYGGEFSSNRNTNRVRGIVALIPSLWVYHN